MWIADNWKDYAVLDCGGGEKVERWGSQVLVRPDPQAIWPRAEGCRAWDKPNAIYHRSNAGASVCHVDASKGMVQWARENAASSGLADRPIRWIVDDCKKFVQREIRRGRKYDAIIMDPPSYGRGPSGETWKIEEDVADFVELTMGVLSDKPLFVLISSYSTGLAPSVMSYLLGITAGKRAAGRIEAQELGLPVESTGLVLPCGSSARFIAEA